ncbi:MAG: hypothetical protein Fur0037_22420 [Planctomycetota bacterium]
MAIPNPPPAYVNFAANNGGWCCLAEVNAIPPSQPLWGAIWRPSTNLRQPASGTAMRVTCEWQKPLPGVYPNPPSPTTPWAQHAGGLRGANLQSFLVWK